MAITQAQKVDYLWKKIGFGKAKTDVNSQKGATNEAISSPLLLRGSEVWSQSGDIPTTMPASSSTIVTVYPTTAPDETTADSTATSNRTWLTGLTDWIPPEIGSTYNVKVYLHTAGDAANAASSGTQVFGAGSGNDDEWFFDYQAGVLNFIGDNLPSGISGKVAYISGARYVGNKGVTGSGGDTSSANLNVTGIATLNQTTTATLNVSAGATISSLIVEDLTDTRIVIAGTGGELEDNANLTYSNNRLVAGGSGISATEVTASGIITATGGFVGNLTGTADVADNVSVTNVSTSNLDLTLTMSDGSNTSAGRALAMDSDLTYNPSTNTLTAGEVSVTTLDIGGTNVTSTATELNILDGATLTTTELNYVDGVTSGIQTQFDNLATLTGVAAGSTNLGTFTGTTISNNVGIKSALQEIETSLESISGGGAQAASVAVGSTDTDASFFLTFVDANNVSPTQETVSTDAGISYNPSTNVLTSTNVSATNITVSGVATVTGQIDGNGGADISGGETTLSSATVSDLTATRLVIAGTSGALEDNASVTFANNQLVLAGAGLTSTQISASGIITATGGVDSSGNVTVKGAGSSTVDYSEVTLSGLSPGTFNTTYTRQANGFVLDGGTVASGNAVFDTDSSYYYYVEDGNNGRIIIFSEVDNAWMAVLQLGEDFRSDNISNNDVLGSPTGSASVTASSETQDGRNVPADSSDIVYATTGTAGVGVATVTTDGHAQFAGIVTAASFSGGSLTVSDLTSGRVLIAGTGGSVDDDAGLTYNATDNALTVGGDIQSSGIVTATTRLSTGAVGTGINIDTDTITGPSSITIDPSTISNNSGTVFILGDLQVKGTTTQIDSTVVTVADLNIQVATGATNDAAANGAGFTVDSGDGDKTFQFEAVGDNFGSSENLNLASGKVLKVNNTEILSASALSNAVSVDVASIDLDGATDIGADLADADLFLVDDGAGGTNRKTTASRLKTYILGGGSGATFGDINVTGIATLNQTTTTTLNVSAGATVTGALDVDGGITANTLIVEDLTDNRVLIAGSGGEVEDSANLTFDGSTLAVTGNLTVSDQLTATNGVVANINSAGVSTVTFAESTTLTVGAGATVTGALDVDGGADISGGETTLSSATVSDLTATRLVIAGTSGALEDDANVTFAADRLVLGGSGLSATEVTASGIVTAASFSGSGAGLSAGTTPVTTLDIDGATDIGADLADSDLLIVDDGAGGTNRKTEMSRIKTYVLGGGSGATFGNINVTGIATLNQSTTTTLNVSAGATVTGALDVDGGADISGGETTLSSATVSDLTATRLVIAGTSGALEDDANVTFANDRLVLGGSGLSATEVTVSGIASASDFRDTDGSLVPLVGVASASAHTGLVTSFKFVGSGLENYVVENEVATVTLSGVAASTYTTSETFTSTTGQTTYTFSAGYTEGFVDVYYNGIRLVTGVDYTATNGSTVVLTSGAAAGDELEIVSFKELGDIVSVQSLDVVDNLTAGIVTVTHSVNGALNFTGVSTAGQLQTTDVNATGIVTAASFSGSGANLSAGTVPLTSIDIDGGTDIGADLADADLLIVDDGAGGTNRKTAMSRVKSYVLGGGSGATFGAINVTGIATVTFADATTLKVSAGATVTGALDVDGGANISGGNGLILTGGATVSAGVTVTGALDVDGGADISGGETTLSSATVSDLTSGRVVLAGTSGALEDSADLTFDGTTLSAPQVSATTSATLASAAVSDLTAGRVVLAGTSGELEDSANLTFGANGLTVTGGSIVSAASTFSNNLDVGGNVIVTGNLTVNGTTTQINTTNTTVEDVLLELQMVDGSAPSSDTNKDVGIVMNYFTDSAKKAAVFWDDSAARFAMASEATETNGVLGSLTYGGLEIGSLYLNDCAGASQVISCSGTTRSLENITIDGGSF